MGQVPSSTMPSTEVPENVQKKQAAVAKLTAAAAAAAAEAKEARKAKRIQAYKNAEKYTREYRALAKQRVRMHRQAKAAGNHFVEGEAKLLFVVRIRGLADMHPKTKKILSFGYPSLKSVRDLIYKRGFGKINKQRLPLNDNAVVEEGLGKYGINCMEDLVHEIYTVGPNFREANNFLWPFKLRPAKGGQAKKRKGFCEGGQAGNREDLMNKLIANML